DRFDACTKHIWRVLIGSRVNRQFSILHNEPRPAGAETAHARRGELFLETGKRSERGFDGCGQVSSGFASRTLFHQRPEQRVVPMTAPVVAYGRADILG